LRGRYGGKQTVGLIQKSGGAASADSGCFLVGEIFHTIRMAREGLLSPYKSEKATSHPKKFCDPNGLWYGFALRARVIGQYSGALRVSAPKCCQDLLDGKCGGMMFAHLNSERLVSGSCLILRRRGGREGERLRTRRDWSKATAQRGMIATGQADICLTDSDDIVCRD